MNAGERVSLATLAQKILRHMNLRPGQGYVANRLSKRFRVPIVDINAALSELLRQDRIIVEVLPPQAFCYFLKPSETPMVKPMWRDLRGWEASLRARQALCEESRNPLRKRRSTGAEDSDADTMRGNEI